MRGFESEPYTRVLDGANEWYYAPSAGIYKNPSGGSYVECGVLLDPVPLLGALQFDSVSRKQRADRAALVSRATLRPRVRASEALQDLSPGADFYELAVDIEHGVLLELRGVLGNREMFRLGVSELSINEPLDDKLFRLEPPPGVEVVDAAKIEPPAEVPLEEAARRASFTVLVPGLRPAGTSLHVRYQPESTSPGAVERVYLYYRFESGSHSLLLAQTAAAASRRTTGGPRSETR